MGIHVRHFTGQSSNGPATAPSAPVPIDRNPTPRLRSLQPQVTPMQLILLLDRDEPTLDALCEVLEFEGYECIESSTAAEGLQLLKDQHPALVITDDELLDMDGVEFLIKKAAVPTTAATPTILITSDPRLRM